MGVAATFACISDVTTWGKGATQRRGGFGESTAFVPLVGMTRGSSNEADPKEGGRKPLSILRV